MDAWLVDVSWAPIAARLEEGGGSGACGGEEMLRNARAWRIITHYMEVPPRVGSFGWDKQTCIISVIPHQLIIR